MKFAIAGCQHVHIKQFIDEMLELGHQFVGIVDDSDFYLPALYAKDYGVPIIDGLDTLLELGVEVVGNAERNDRKLDVMEWCASHGLHVMTDKPIAVDEAGLQRLRQLIDRGEVAIGMMLTERFEPSLQQLKRLIDDGELGELLDVTFLKPHKAACHRRPGWFFEKSVNGGLIIDLLIHDVDLMNWLLGRPILQYEGKLLKTTLFDYPELYDKAILNIVYEGLVTATMKSDWLMPEAVQAWGDGRIFVTGTKGRAEIRSAGDLTGEPGPCVNLMTNSQPAQRLDVPDTPVKLSEDFMRQIRGEAVVLSPEEIYACNEAVIRMDRAAAKLIL